jgi:hypothetical protein
MRAPSLAALAAALLARGIVASTFDPWFFVDGVLGGFDAPGLPPASLTLDAARAACAANDACFGYSCAGAVPPPPAGALLQCVFKSATAAGDKSGWQSFVRCGIESPCPAPPPCTPGTWASANGFLADGGDVLTPGPSTFASAQATCIATSGCLGITFDANSSQPEGVIPTVFFKNQTDEVDDSGASRACAAPACAAPAAYLRARRTLRSLVDVDCLSCIKP